VLKTAERHGTRRSKVCRGDCVLRNNSLLAFSFHTFSRHFLHYNQPINIRLIKAWQNAGLYKWIIRHTTNKKRSNPQRCDGFKSGVDGGNVGRLWYTESLVVEMTMDSDRQAALSSSPVEIGCVNVIPKCSEWTGTHPVYEHLPETYAAINNYLAESPLEGTTCLHISHSLTYTKCESWQGFRGVEPPVTLTAPSFLI